MLKGLMLVRLKQVTAMLQQAKKKKKAIMHSLRNLSKEVMGVAAAPFGFGESLEQEVLWDVPRETYRNKGYKVREKSR